MGQGQQACGSSTQQDISIYEKPNLDSCELNESSTVTYSKKDSLHST